MNTAVITIKTPLEVKTQAQGTAKELGFSLSSLINAYLRQLIKTKVVHFSLEEPTPFLTASLEESARDLARGNVSPEFNNAKDAMSWLNGVDTTYVGKIQQKISKTIQ